MVLRMKGIYIAQPFIAEGMSIREKYKIYNKSHMEKFFSKVRIRIDTAKSDIHLRLSQQRPGLI